jgi:hypothetical protein
MTEPGADAFRNNQQSTRADPKNQEMAAVITYDNERDLENPEIPYEVAKALYKACDLVYGTDFRKVFAVQSPWVRNAGLLVCAENRNECYMKILIEMGANVHDPKIMSCLKTRQGWDEPREYARGCMKVLKAAGACA